MSNSISRVTIDFSDGNKTVLTPDSTTGNASKTNRLAKWLPSFWPRSSVSKKTEGTLSSASSSATNKYTKIVKLSDLDKSQWYFHYTDPRTDPVLLGKFVKYSERIPGDYQQRTYSVPAYIEFKKDNETKTIDLDNKTEDIDAINNEIINAGIYRLTGGGAKNRANPEDTNGRREPEEIVAKAGKSWKFYTKHPLFIDFITW
jgi:hypothetical protein